MEKNCVLKFKKKDVPSDIGNRNIHNKGSAEIIVCVAMLILTVGLTFVLEYASLIYKAEIFKEDLRTILETALEKEAENSLYELRHAGQMVEKRELIERFLENYSLEEVSIERISDKSAIGYSVTGKLILHFHFSGKEAFTIKVPFFEQKMYRYIAGEEE